MTLQTQLDAFKADLEAGMPPAVLKVLHRAIDNLITSGAAGRALKAGDKAPAFVLNDPMGQPVSSNTLLARGPLVISFYRGVWCPFCNIELKALQAELPNYQALGASLVAISPQTEANSRQSVHDNSLSFPILSDPGNAVAAAFGLRYALGDELVELHKALNIALPDFNGDDSWTLAMPARYVVGPGGLILFAEVNPDATRRPEPSDLLPALRGAAARVL